jgi:N-acetylglucosamine kinase-like BadF-type ATPase
MTFVGLDVGGSKTVCVVVSAQEVINRIQGPGSNLHQEGIAGTTRQIVSLVDEALPSRRGRSDIVYAAACIAGLDTEDSRQSMLEALNEAEPRVRWRPENDAVGAWKGAFGCRTTGVVAIAGTGAAAYARNGRREARAGGWGALLGDEGGGYSIGRAALIAVLREQDGMGPPTALTPSLLRELGARRSQDIVDLVHFQMTPSEIAALAPRVLSQAASGDAEARRVVEEAAAALVETARAAARAVAEGGMAMPFAAIGGISQDEYYRARLRHHLEQAPQLLVWHRPEASPVIGAIYLAMERAGVPSTALLGLDGAA